MHSLQIDGPKALPHFASRSALKFDLRWSRSTAYTELLRRFLQVHGVQGVLPAVLNFQFEAGPHARPEPLRAERGIYLFFKNQEWLRVGQTSYSPRFTSQHYGTQRAGSTFAADVWNNREEFGFDGDEGDLDVWIPYVSEFRHPFPQKKGAPKRGPVSFADRARDYTARVFMPVARSAPKASAPASDPFYSVLRAWEQLCPDPGQVNPDLGGPMVRPTTGETLLPNGKTFAQNGRNYARRDTRLSLRA
jgi:hypothetical protein